MKNRLPIRVLAIHLPQFHPIPENDLWWGRGFTEWTKVAAAKPLFPGHRQPRLPADLGHYDLRLPEARAAQARLAAAHGIDGFCYYHYWFNGRRLLETPVREILRRQSPDFPFCLFWANETWSRRWLGEERDILLRQTYSEDDNQRHAAYLAAVFQDSRYIRVNGRPPFLIYRPTEMPCLDHFVRTLRQRCATAGVPSPLLLGSSSHAEGIDLRLIGLDGTLDFQPKLALLPDAFSNDGDPTREGNRDFGVEAEKPKIYAERPFRREMANLRGARAHAVYPSVYVGWDNTPRRGVDGLVVHPGSAAAFREGLDDAIAYLDERGGELDEPILFLNAWNEWAEGNYLEPDTVCGVRHLQQVKLATQPAREEDGGRATVSGFFLPEWPADKEFILGRIGGPATLKMCAKVLDEPVMLRAWIEHHARIVGWDNLIVADNFSKSPESAALYAEYGDRINIFRLGGNCDLIHSHSSLDDLYGRLRTTCDFFAFIDCDERLTLCTPGSWSADHRINDFLAAGHPLEIVPTTWIYNHVDSHDHFQISPQQYYAGLDQGLLWGKPLLPSALVGLEKGPHNVQHQGFAFAPRREAFLLLLHCCRFPRQRIEANRKKLIYYGAIDDTWTVDDILAANSIGAPDRVERCKFLVQEIREMRDHLATGAKARFPAFLRLNPEGTISYSDEQSQAQVEAYFRDWDSLRRKLLGAGGRATDPGSLLHAPARPWMDQSVARLRAAGSEAQARLLEERLHRLGAPVP